MIPVLYRVGAQAVFPDLANECQCWVHNCSVFDEKRQELDSPEL